MHVYFFGFSKQLRYYQDSSCNAHVIGFILTKQDYLLKDRLENNKEGINLWVGQDSVNAHILRDMCKSTT